MRTMIEDSVLHPARWDLRLSYLRQSSRGAAEVHLMAVLAALLVEQVLRRGYALLHPRRGRSRSGHRLLRAPRQAAHGERRTGELARVFLNVVCEPTGQKLADHLWLVVGRRFGEPWIELQIVTTGAILRVTHGSHEGAAEIL